MDRLVISKACIGNLSFYVQKRKHLYRGNLLCSATFVLHLVHGLDSTRTINKCIYNCRLGSQLIDRESREQEQHLLKVMGPSLWHFVIAKNDIRTKKLIQKHYHLSAAYYHHKAVIAERYPVFFKDLIVRFTLKN